VSDAPTTSEAAPSLADADLSDPLLEAELEAATAAAAPGEHSISVYGFMDFRYSAVLGDTVGTFSRYPTFAVGDFNVYLDAQLGDGWRSLAEVRFMYLPHGSALTIDQGGNSDQRYSAVAADYADVNRPLTWGGIEIERAWLEYEFDELLAVRMGQWITPYGIWVVDHGSPVIIGVTRPYVVGEALFPERQTGFLGHGALFFARTKVGYDVTLSNGRGPVDAYQDLDTNKAIGGRLFLDHPFDVGTLTVGSSVYRGTYTDRAQSVSVDDSGALTTYNPPSEAYDELSWAADVKWDQKALLAQAEFIMNDVAYREGARPASRPGLPGGTGYTPDHRRFGGYALVAYRSPWFNITPFVGGEYNRWGKHFPVPDVAAFWFGLNVRPNPRVVWKVSHTYATFPTETETAIVFKPLHLLSAQVAWSF
jgi:hypothetical protein